MFYSHEVLTSRQHGVATIWLVATLGSKSTLKKVTRKAILDVDVPKACGTISDPSAPMALRLQGNLLYGVSRVYSQQCGYVLADTQNFRDKMRGVFVVMKEMEIDPDVAKARQDQLNLPDDPAFLPDLDMNLDLSMFDTSTDESRQSDFMSTPSRLSSQSSHAPAGSEGLELIFPSSDPNSGGDNGGFGSAREGGLAQTTSGNAGRLSMFEDTGLIEDPGFEFDQEGNIIDLPRPAERQTGAESATGLAAGLGSRIGSDSAISARVRQEHEAGLQGFQFGRDLNAVGGPLTMVDDDLPLPGAEPFSSPPRPTTEAQARPNSSAAPTQILDTSSTAEAPQRQKQVRPRMLQFDDRQELFNTELAQWNKEYLSNMEDAIKAKYQNKLVAQAKKNAAFWVLGQGIGGVGVGLGQNRVKGPLETFSGESLLAVLAGKDFSPAGAKHARSLSGEVEEIADGRRVRTRSNEEEHVGRDDEAVLTLEDDDGILFPGETNLEIGREAPPSIPDRSSQMPWNTSASRYGSARPIGCARGRISSSVAVITGGMELGPPPGLRSRRGSRLTSASPLLGRGATAARYSSLEIPGSAELVTGAVEATGGGSMHLDTDLQGEEEFELYGPAAAVDTPTAAQSQWLSAALDTESQDFLGFLTEQLDAEAAEQHEDEGSDDGAGRKAYTTLFESLLPPSQHTKSVAAQALLHVLSLATKGLIYVQQAEAFGEIEIGLLAVRGTATGEEGDE